MAVVLRFVGRAYLFAHLSLSALAWAESKAEEATPNGPEIVVTAPSLPEDDPTSPMMETARARLLNLPSAIDVVSSADLQKGRGSYLEDFLRNQPGLIIQSAQGSEDSKVSARGSGVQNDDLSGLSILLDGIPLNQADGEAFLQDLDLQTIKYAEVYRGGDALQYGAVTLGGAINLVTLTGRDADPFTARLSFGSFGLAEEQIASAWNNERQDIYVSLTNHLLDGFREHSEENSQKLFVSFGDWFGDTTENRFYFFFGRLAQNNPSSLTKEELTDDPRQTIHWQSRKTGARAGLTSDWPIAWL